ncbi:dodecin domain-containing protein [Rhodococcus kroppenstedtii]|nr:dodecin domain-containing protein [Rhodococcus kroppenstedtii]MDV7197131.1 dodecin domain-containing protein [Rhodococcus kroppenstedtii]
MRRTLVHRVTEIVGTSTEGVDDAIRTAVAHFQVTLEVGVELEA